MTQPDKLSNEYEVIVKEATQKVELALHGVGLGEQMIINFQVGKISAAYARAENDWHNRLSDAEDEYPPHPTLYKNDPEIIWHEKLVVLADEKGNFDNITFAVLKTTLAKTARSFLGDI